MALPNSIRVYVNRDCVKRAEKLNGYHGFDTCPIANALKKKLNYRYKVEVGNNEVILRSKRGVEYTYKLGKRGRAAVLSFDNYRLMNACHVRMTKV